VETDFSSQRVTPNHLENSQIAGDWWSRPKRISAAHLPRHDKCCFWSGRSGPDTRGFHRTFTS